MAERDFRLERHFELWKEQNRQVVRWAFGTAIFATIVLLRVLVPYTDSSARVAAGQAELARAEQELATIEAEQQALAKVSQRLEAVRATIDGQPWDAEKRQLIQGLRELNEAFRILAGASLAEVRQAIREAGPPIQAQIAQQNAPGSRMPHPLARAVAEVGLDPDRLDAVSPGEFRRLLDEHLPRRAQEEADEKVRRISQRVSGEVLQPLERLLQDDPEAARVLPALPPMLARTRADMAQWVQQHLGNREWFRTIRGKDQELGELTASLRQRQEALLSLVREQQKSLEPRRKALADRQRQAQAQASAIGKALVELNTKLQKLLPEWLRDLASPEEMLQLYPLVLLGLAGVIGFKAGLVRHHYVVVRERQRLADLSFQDTAVSSLWTLVYRGRLGTAVTGAVYLGGIAWMWWLFEHGSGLAAAWAVAQPDAVWSVTRDWLPVVRWVGRVAFPGALAGVVAVLVRDRASTSRRTPADSPPPAPAAERVSDSAGGGRSR